MLFLELFGSESSSSDSVSFFASDSVSFLVRLDCLFKAGDPVLMEPLDEVTDEGVPALESFLSMASLAEGSFEGFVFDGVVLDEARVGPSFLLLDCCFSVSLGGGGASGDS